MHLGNNFPNVFLWFLIYIEYSFLWRELYQPSLSTGLTLAFWSKIENPLLQSLGMAQSIVVVCFGKVEVFWPNPCVQMRPVHPRNNFSQSSWEVLTKWCSDASSVEKLTPLKFTTFPSRSFGSRRVWSNIEICQVIGDLENVILSYKPL